MNSKFAKLLRFILFFNCVLINDGVVMATENKSEKEITTTLNLFHNAASVADGKTYFDLFAPEGVFIGTDASERWSVAEFKAYATPFFSKGKGWTYTPHDRHINMTPSGDTAWFDELLDHKSYGLCRGSGVLRKIKSSWKIVQYHLTIPLPNSLTEKVVKLIQDESKTKSHTK